MDKTISTNDADSISLSLKSETSGTQLTETVTLVIGLEDYPSSTPANFEINLVYRECFPKNFSVPSMSEIWLRVAE